MPELERDKLIALCTQLTAAALSAGLRAALDAGGSGNSTRPIPAGSVLGTYEIRATLNFKRKGPILGFPELIVGLKSTDFERIVVSKVEYKGENYYAFTDEDFSDLIGVLRGPVNPQNELMELLRDARQLKLRDDDN